MVLRDGAVMSKSKGNVVDPDDMIAKFGADALRLYVMFVAPPEKEVEWTDTGLEGSFRFLGRVWRMVDHLMPALPKATRRRGAALDDDERGAAAQDARDDRARDARHRSAHAPEHRDLGADGAGQRAVRVLPISAGSGPTGREDEPPPVIERPETAAVLREAVEALVLMLSPFTPHLAEELWERLRPDAGERGIAAAGWPAVDEDAAREEEIEMPVQVNGKLRARITVDAEASEAEIRRAHWPRRT